MTESAFKKAQLKKVPDEFICPISQTIMRDPVFNEQGTTFDRNVIELWIDEHQTDPLTRKPLFKKDLKPNRALREGIYKFVQSLLKKQKEQIEQESEDMDQKTNWPLPDIQKLLRQLEIVKNQLLIQKYQKEQLKWQCEIQRQRASIDRKSLNDCETRNMQLKESNQMLQQNLKKNENYIQASKNQNIKLRNQKDFAKIQCQKMMEQLKKHQEENIILNKEILELKQLQQVYRREIEELKAKLYSCQSNKQDQKKLIQRSRKVEITPDKQSRGFRDNQWKLDNTNMNICIVNANYPQWICSSLLPFDDEFVFTIKAIKLTGHIAVGVMEAQMIGQKEGYTLKHSVFLNTYYQGISRPNEEQTSEQFIECQCFKQLPQCPFQIECHLNRLQNTIAWHYANKQQAKSKMPKTWKTNKKQLCAIFYLMKKDDSLEMM